MTLRRGLVGLAGSGILTISGLATAKPPDLPGDPLIEGRESTPVAREYYETETPRPVFGTVANLPYQPVPLRWLPNVSPISDFVTGVCANMLNRFTIPLGHALIQE